jgi:endoglycosylceramidase
LLFPINDTFPLFERIFCDDIQRDLCFSSIKKDIENIGGGSFLTEFGVCALCKEDGTCLTSECETILTSSDAYFTSWSYGDSNFYTANGSLNNPIIKLFSRIYPKSTSGKPISLVYNANTLLFNYSYEHNPSINQPTEIYVPEFLYKNRFQVTVSDHLKYDFDNSSHLLISVDDNWSKPFNATIVIQILN